MRFFRLLGGCRRGVHRRVEIARIRRFLRNEAKQQKTRTLLGSKSFMLSVSVPAPDAAWGTFQNIAELVFACGGRVS